MRAIDERVSVVRTAIAGYVTPEQVEEMTRGVEPMLVPLALQKWGEAEPAGAPAGEPPVLVANDD